jgi:hypothetical protein
MTAAKLQFESVCSPPFAGQLADMFDGIYLAVMNHRDHAQRPVKNEQKQLAKAAPRRRLAAAQASSGGWLQGQLCQANLPSTTWRRPRHAQMKLLFQGSVISLAAGKQS